MFRKVAWRVNDTGGPEPPTFTHPDGHIYATTHGGMQLFLRIAPSKLLKNRQKQRYCDPCWPKTPRRHKSSPPAQKTGVCPRLEKYLPQIQPLNINAARRAKKRDIMLG